MNKQIESPLTFDETKWMRIPITRIPAQAVVQLFFSRSREQRTISEPTAEDLGDTLSAHKPNQELQVIKPTPSESPSIAIEVALPTAESKSLVVKPKENDLETPSSTETELTKTPRQADTDALSVSRRSFDFSKINMPRSRAGSSYTTKANFGRAMPASSQDEKETTHNIGFDKAMPASLQDEKEATHNIGFGKAMPASLQDEKETTHNIGFGKAIPTSPGDKKGTEGLARKAGFNRAILAHLQSRQKLPSDRAKEKLIKSKFIISQLPEVTALPISKAAFNKAVLAHPRNLQPKATPTPLPVIRKVNFKRAVPTSSKVTKTAVLPDSQKNIEQASPKHLQNQTELPSSADLTPPQSSTIEALKKRSFTKELDLLTEEVLQHKAKNVKQVS